MYAATANISIPLVLTLVVWVTYNVEGIRGQGVPPVLQELAAARARGHESRRQGLQVRDRGHVAVRALDLPLGAALANILAGHLLLLFWAAGSRVLLGIAALAAITFPIACFFIVLEVGLIATLQAFIWATFTAIYIGGATSESH